jgi:peptidoglycan hydrolase-like protein with peptidoglycan-binding domain
VYSDQQIDDDLGVQSAPVPTRIKNLSALLTAIRIFSRPDMRFRMGQSGLSEQQIQENLNTWKADVARIYAYYGKVVPEGPESLGMV